MIAVCPTVPHTGTHFIGQLLDQAVVAGVLESVLLQHPYYGYVAGVAKLIRDGNLCIIPRRRPHLVRISWERYGKDSRDFAGRSLEEWYQVQLELATLADSLESLYYLDIDQPGIRDIQLRAIEDAIGFRLMTDWLPVRQVDAAEWDLDYAGRQA